MANLLFFILRSLLPVFIKRFASLLQQTRIFNCHHLLLQSPCSTFWSTSFFTIFTRLCFSRQHFTAVLSRYASGRSLQFPNECTARNNDDNRYFLASKKGTWTSTPRPTILLRICTATGYSIVVRALLDTGTRHSCVFADLAALLIEKGGATANYDWPASVSGKMTYRLIEGLQVQSLVDESAIIESASFNIDEISTLNIDQLPLDEVARKLAQWNLHLYPPNGLQNESTMWSVDATISEWRYDMLIGQDLLSRHFCLSPVQPTYHITPSLAIMRTRMGLTLMGRFDVQEFDDWQLSQSEADHLRATLYPEVQPTEPNRCMDITEEFASRCTTELSPMKWKTLGVFFVVSVLFTHLFALLLLAICFAVYLKALLLIIPSFLATHLVTIYSTYLLQLLRLANSLRHLYHFFLQPVLNNITTRTVSTSAMHYLIDPILAVNIDQPSPKKVLALLDTGSPHSFISPQLVEDLGAVIQILPSKDDGDLWMMGGKEVVKLSLVRADGTQVEVSFYVPTSKQFNHLFTSAWGSIPEQVENTISQLLGIQYTNYNSIKPYQLLFGADLIASLLLVPSTFNSNRCHSLAANLTLVETSLGYYLQGYQLNRSLVTNVRNWYDRNTDLWVSYYFANWRDLFEELF